VGRRDQNKRRKERIKERIGILTLGVMKTLRLKINDNFSREIDSSFGGE